MNIAIDIDDTITDTFDYIQPYIAEYFGVDEEELKKRNISYSNMPKEWDELAFGKKYYDDTIPGAPIKPGAVEAIEKLKEMGHKIFIITARTDAYYKDPYKMTTDVLTKAGIVYDKVICTFDKGKACREEHIDLLIDDSRHNCNCAAEAGARTLLFTSKANKDYETNHTRVADWKAVIEILSK